MEFANTFVIASVIGVSSLGVTAKILTDLKDSFYFGIRDFYNYYDCRINRNYLCECNASKELQKICPNQN